MEPIFFFFSGVDVLGANQGDAEQQRQQQQCTNASRIRGGGKGKVCTPHITSFLLRERTKQFRNASSLSLDASSVLVSKENLFENYFLELNICIFLNLECCEVC